MSDENSPDWLPAGWTVQYKFLKTGRKVAHYVNLATGQKFFTKDDLLLALRQTKATPKKSRNNTAVVVYERPEWLPEDWFVELKMYERGGKIHQEYKMYVDPSTGSKFYSKPEVLRYLNHVKQETSLSAEMPLQCSCQTVAPANERPEWLPNSWFMELKSGANVGRHKKVYIDPSTGRRFYNKPQVLRFLSQVRQKSGKFKQKKRERQSKVTIEKSTVDDLPAGWIKEVKIRRNVNRVRRDPYYIDPASGYVFLSKKSALHYLETGETGRYAFLPKKTHIDYQNGDDTEKSHLPVAKMQKVEHPVTKQQMIRVVLEMKKLLESGIKKRNNIKSTRCVVKHFPTEPNGSCVSEDKATEQLNCRSDAGAAEQSFTDSTVKSCGSLTKTTMTSTKDEDVQGKQLQMLETLKTSDAMSEIQPLVCVDTYLESSITAVSNVLQEKKPGNKRTRSKSSDIKTKKSSKSEKMEELKLRCQSSKQLAQAVPELLTNGVTKEAPIQNVATCSGKVVDPKEDSINPHGDKATMWGTQKAGDIKSELQSFICSDPSLEFAIKTLTGAIPLGDAITEGHVSNPQQQKNLSESGFGEASYRKELFNSIMPKKKDCSLPRGFEQFSGNSNEGFRKFAAKNSCNSKGLWNADLTKNLIDKAYQQLKTDPIMVVEHHYFPYKTNVLQVGSSNKGKVPHHNQSVPTHIKNEKPGVQSEFPFGNPWSGPAESSISFKNYFQHQIVSSGTQKGGNNFTLPYDGLPNVSQSNISSQIDAGTQPVVQQHFPVNKLA